MSESHAAPVSSHALPESTDRQTDAVAATPVAGFPFRLVPRAGEDESDAARRIAFLRSTQAKTPDGLPVSALLDYVADQDERVAVTALQLFDVGTLVRNAPNARDLWDAKRRISEAAYQEADAAGMLWTPRLDWLAKRDILRGSLTHRSDRGDRIAAWLRDQHPAPEMLDAIERAFVSEDIQYVLLKHAPYAPAQLERHLLLRVEPGQHPIRDNTNLPLESALAFIRHIVDGPDSRFHRVTMDAVAYFKDNQERLVPHARDVCEAMVAAVEETPKKTFLFDAVVRMSLFPSDLFARFCDHVVKMARTYPGSDHALDRFHRYGLIDMAALSGHPAVEPAQMRAMWDYAIETRQERHFVHNLANRTVPFLPATRAVVHDRLTAYIEKGEPVEEIARMIDLSDELLARALSKGDLRRMREYLKASAHVAHLPTAMHCQLETSDVDRLFAMAISANVAPWAKLVALQKAFKKNPVGIANAIQKHVGYFGQGIPADCFAPMMTSSDARTRDAAFVVLGLPCIRYDLTMPTPERRTVVPRDQAAALRVKEKRAANTKRPRRR